MEGQSSLRKQAKFSRIILRSTMPNEHPVATKTNTTTRLLYIMLAFFERFSGANA